MELTRSYSESASNSIADDGSDGFPASPFQNANQFRKWTDDKHRLYLDSLEASFINELNNSLQLRAWSLGHNVTFMQENSPNPRDKCVVLREGCWQKIEYKTNGHPMDSTADSPLFMDDTQLILNPGPLETCSENRQPKNLTTSFVSAGNIDRLIQYDFCCQYSVGTSEVSDQNFVDDIPVRASVNTSRHKR